MTSCHKWCMVMMMTTIHNCNALMCWRLLVMPFFKTEDDEFGFSTKVDLKRSLPQWWRDMSVTGPLSEELSVWQIFKHVKNCVRKSYRTAGICCSSVHPIVWCQLLPVNSSLYLTSLALWDYREADFEAVCIWTAEGVALHWVWDNVLRRQVVTRNNLFFCK